jgi:uncharacterized protein YggL (DUF469 family)
LPFIQRCVDLGRGNLTWSALACRAATTKIDDAEREVEGDLLADQKDIDRAQVEVVEIGHG